MTGKIDHLFVDKSDSIRSVMECMEGNKPKETGIPSGVALVVDKSRKLIGIATDGDIRRGLVRHGRTMDDAISLVMNEKPFFITGNRSALSIMSVVSEKTRVSRWDKGRLEKIIIVDDAQRPVDLVSIYDLWRASDVRFKRIGMVGLGYVGLTLGLTLADLGFPVVGYDTNPGVIDAIKKGKPHFYEKGLHELLSDHLGKKFTLTKSFADENSCDVYFISVGTPLDAKKRPSLVFLEHAARDLGKVLKQGDLVVLRSTVPLGTTRNVVLPLLEKGSGLRAGEDFLVAFAPERTIEGKAIEELRHLPQVVGGYNHASAELASNIFSFMTASIVLVDSLEEAEMVKLVNNTYRDVSFGFANEVSLIAHQWGIDGKKVITAANTGYARSTVPLPSPGVGGYCLEKDPYILFHSAKEKNHEGHIITRGRDISERMLDRIADEVVLFLRKHSGDLSRAKVLVIGFAFKGKPATSDTRGSTTYALIDRLKKRKVRSFYGYDPLVVSEQIESHAVRVKDLKKEISAVHAVLVMNNNTLYEELDMRALLGRSKNKVLLYDAWGLYPREEIAKVPHVEHRTL